MEFRKDEHTEYSAELDKFVKILPKLIGCTITALALIYFVPRIVMLTELSLDAAVWGAVGDFFGGLLNPILSILTILLLVRSLQMQSRELGDASKEMRLTREVHTQSLLYADIKQVFQDRAAGFKHFFSVPLKQEKDSSGESHKLDLYSAQEEIASAILADKLTHERFVLTLQHIDRELKDFSAAGVKLLEMNIDPIVLRATIESLVDEVIMLQEMCTELKHSDFVSEGINQFHALLGASRIELIPPLNYLDS